MPDEAPAIPAAENSEPISFDEALKLAREDAAAIEGEEPPPEPKPVKAKAVRDPGTGKFIPGDKVEGEEPAAADDAEKAKAKAEPAKKPEAKVEADDAPAGSIGKVRRLWHEGKIEDAVKLAFGVEATELELTSRQWNAFKREARETKQRATETLQEAQRKSAEVNEIGRALMPLIQARQAYQAGDLETFLRLSVGESISSFNQRAARSLAGQAALDPQAEQRLAQLEQRAQAAEHRAREAEQRAVERNRQEQAAQYVEQVADELRESEDPRFTKAVGKKLFMNRVIEIQQEYWDPSSKSTLPAVEAAEMAWEELYGDVFEAPPERQGKAALPARRQGTGATTPRTGTSARMSAKAGTSLRHSQAAEAAPEEELSQDEIFDYFVKKAKSEARAPG